MGKTKEKGSSADKKAARKASGQSSFGPHAAASIPH